MMSVDLKVDEEEDRFQSRQKLLSAEVHNLSESIRMKEELLQQLHKSQEQYSMMRSFYHNRLEMLSKEMEAKESEREQLVAEIESLAAKSESSPSRLTMESKLRELLSKKDDELKKLRKKHQEVNRLSDIQAKYAEKLSSLDEEISTMKKQRIDLSKTLQLEKRAHAIAIGEKAKEIEKLKRDLHRRTGEMKKLAEDKERAEFRVKDALREGAMLRKKANDLQKFGPAESITAITMARKLALSRATTSKSKSFSQDQLKTKAWLDKRLHDITAKEKTVNTLMQKYEQQLQLLDQKHKLERERDEMESRVLVEGQLENSSTAFKPVGSLREIDNLMESLDRQLSAKVKDIDDMQYDLMGSRGLADNERTLEHLHAYAKSLPDAHELIRLLFDMLVKSSVSASNRFDSAKQLEEMLKSTEAELQEKRTELIILHRAKESEMTKITTLYEEKLFGLLEHSSIGQLLTEALPINGLIGESVAPENVSVEDIVSKDQMNAFFSISNERARFLKSESERLAASNEKLEVLLAEKEMSINDLTRLNSERNEHIRFLEEECSVFKHIADDLRSGLLAVSSGNGSSSIKKMISVQSRERLNFSDDDDDEEVLESEDTIFEFISLADEIQKTGEVSLEPVKPIVFDRLTNPSNFTGSQKNVFLQNLMKKKDGKTSGKIKRRESLENVTLDRDSTTLSPTFIDEERQLGSTIAGFEGLSKECTPLESAPLANTFPRPSRVKTPLVTLSADAAVSSVDTNVFTRLNNPSRYTGIQKYRGVPDSVEDIQLGGGVKASSGLQPSPPRSRSSSGLKPSSDVSLLLAETNPSLNVQQPAKIPPQQAKK